MVFLDGTTIYAHHKAAGAVKKGGTENTEKIVKRVAAHVEDLVPRSAEQQMVMAGHCLSRFRPVRHMNCRAPMACSMTCRTHQSMSSVIVGMPRTNSVSIYGTGEASCHPATEK
ncbi:hypothetical protein Gain_0465_002 [Komagataeibacter intermedius TF2]|uniref:Transposase n=2 Tax=Komagataeibacter intermedius TaxID=66229 RepID=A0A0N1N7H1_9PROT|nr:transposase [Komagataeibacter intermedius AF2]GAN88704.1 hypothetical protein Gain_0465_002 [Komagataeibacter intermedius TF2]GBQ71183.1 hypothetical protein AA0521_1854 [Komagataeibacter intermedius NRIC 0521]